MSNKAASAWQRVEDVVSVLGVRHAVAVVCALAGAPLTYTEIRKMIPGLTDATLTIRLKALEDAGIVKRTVSIETRRPTILYELTKRGAGLKPIISAINDWASGPRVVEPERKKKAS